MKKILIAILLFFLTFTGLYAKTWKVGPGKVYAVPSMVSTLVHDGDSVVIDSGLYTQDVAQWSANNLVLIGAKGFVHLNGNGTTYGGKAIWVISGNNVRVENIEFYNASCPDKNGAGIRAEGANLTVHHCYFHNNEDGILAGDNANSDILIEYSSFRANGYGDGYSHNLYINHVHKLIFQFNLTHLAKVGHELKSRALHNFILYNCFRDETTGTASRSIDLPNGGFSVIMGNVIEKGPLSQNSNVIGYGLEGLTNPDSQLFVVNNTFVNDKGTASFIQLQNGTKFCKVYNNIFANGGTIISGSATVDSSHNIAGPLSYFHFLSLSQYNYHFFAAHSLPTTTAGKADTLSLTPVFEYGSVYNDSGSSRVRNTIRPLDCGAFQHYEGGIASFNREYLKVNVYPNPSNGNFCFDLNGERNKIKIELIDYTGKEVWNNIMNMQGVAKMSLPFVAAGVYILKISDGEAFGYQRLVILR